MLTRRTLMVITATLAASCGPFRSSLEVPQLLQPIALTWHAMPDVHRFRVGQSYRNPRRILSEVVDALEEDGKNPNGPESGHYTLTGHALEYPAPIPRRFEEIEEWVGGVETDILSLDARMASALGERGVLLPLDRFIANDEPILTESFYPYLLGQFRGSGGLYGLPVSAEPLMLHYDAEYFARQNVPPVDESWDWDDLVANAKKLTRRGEDGEVIRWGLMSHMQGFWWALWQNEAKIFDVATGRCRLQESAAGEALRFCYDLLHTHRVSPTIGAQESSRIFTLPDELWPAMSYVPYQSMWRRGYRWAELPRGNVRSVPVRADVGLAIHAQTKHTERAYTALKGLLNAMQRFVHVPAQSDAVTRLEEFHPNLPPEEAAALQRSLDYGHALPHNVEGPTMYQIVDDLARGANVATVVNDACSALDE